MGKKKFHLPPAAAATPPAQRAFCDDVDAYIERQIQRLNIPGASLAIVEGDRIIHLRGFGRARPGGDTPLPETPFFIGSLTKSFTALAVMQLVEGGKVELDAPVQRYLPWFRVADPQASAQITLRHLLNQTGSLPMLPGMANLANFDSLPGCMERQVRALAEVKIARPVGTKFEYSNLNYNVLGLVVEAASGEDYAGYIQRHIFDPLGMRHSFTSKAAAQQYGLAMGHRFWFGQPVAAPDLPVPIGSLSSGQLISCAEDMAHYLIANLNGGRYDGRQILSSAGMDDLHRGAAEINEMGQSFGSYGMGWISQGSGTSRIVVHSGIVPDFGAYMALAPGQKRGLVLLVNANHAMMKLTYDEMGAGAAQYLIGERPAPPRFDALPWLMRSQLLLPFLLIASVIGTLGQVHRWRRAVRTRPTPGQVWGRHILLPLFPSGLAGLALLPMLGRLRGFLRLFMPDYSWTALICGGFAAVWSFLRTRLVLQSLRDPRQGRSGR